MAIRAIEVGKKSAKGRLIPEHFCAPKCSMRKRNLVGATMYATAFSCHNCAREAADLHPDAVSLNARTTLLR